MRILIITLLTFGLCLFGISEELGETQPKIETEREVKTLEKDAGAELKKQFMGNYWFVIVPEYEKQNKLFKEKGVDLNIRIVLVTHPKTSEAHVEILNDYDAKQNAKSGKVKVVLKNNKLHLTRDDGVVVATIHKKADVFFYTDANSQAEYKMKVKP